MDSLILTHRSVADGSGGPADDLTLEQITDVALRGRRVEVEAETLALLGRRRAAAVAAIEADPGRPVYGFNTGFGSNLRESVPQGRPTAELQANLIRSHALCTGPLAPREVVRAAMLMRARSLARGHSAVSPGAVALLAELLNRDIVPAVPRYGTVSASGDLAPLSHIALVLMGEGEVMDPADPAGQRRIATAELVVNGAFTPLTLGMKDGLALNNGCQYSAAWMALAADRMGGLIRAAALSTALSAQVMMGADSPFGPQLHALRPHPGSRQVAGWIHALMQDSPMREFHRDFDVDGEVQDPYNLRCAGQVLGPCLDLIERARVTLEIEANSVTDNPIDLNWLDGSAFDPARITSGGHFHGMPLAVDAYGLVQAAGIMARLSNMRCVRFVDARRNRGLGPQARWPAETPEGFTPEQEAGRATRSGMLIAEYVTAGLTNWIWGLAMPSHLFSLSTDSGQEDHVSMAANVAMRAHEATERLAEILAAEMAFASQALEIRRAGGHLRTGPQGPLYDSPEAARARTSPARGPRPVRTKYDERGQPVLVTTEEVRWRPLGPESAELSPMTAKAIGRIREAFALVEEDRVLAGDLSALAKAVLAGDVTAATGFGF